MEFSRSRSIRRINPTIEVTGLGRRLSYLCRKAEPRLRESIKDNEVILVNGTFLVKPNNGALAGVGVAEIEVADGQRVFPTKWYIPDGGWRVKKQIIDAFFAGESTIDISETTTWIEVRRIRPFTLSRRRIRNVAQRLQQESLQVQKQPSHLGEVTIPLQEVVAKSK